MTVRIELAEDDLDAEEAARLAIERKLDRILFWLVTGAITFSFSAIAVAINLAYQLR